VTVGRLTEQKRIGLILEAAATLARRGRRMPVTIIGDGPEREPLGRLADTLGIGGDVQFLGEVPPGRLAQAMDDADVFAFAARHEGFGLAPAEALMLGIPVVATEDGGGVTDVVPASGGGRLVLPAPDAIARAIEDVLGDAHARTSAADVGETLRGRLSPESAAQTFDAIYAAAVRRGAP
jgi:glycosyltransferase involved in cell wall biosynthesis